MGLEPQVRPSPNVALEASGSIHPPRISFSNNRLAEVFSNFHKECEGLGESGFSLHFERANGFWRPGAAYEALILLVLSKPDVFGYPLYVSANGQWKCSHWQ
jgi:hypothetical protein